MVRLNKYLADCGIASRRKCDDLIVSGKVTVNGRVPERLGVNIDETRDTVRFEGVLVKPVARLEYVMLNKPLGYVTTTSDEKGRKTVVDLVDIATRIFPVGRLDIDTGGLLLLTNDGELAYKLTHPRFEVEKIYDVRLNRALASRDRRRLESGISLEEGVTAACRVEFPDAANRRHVQLTLHQGWNRQIRRMFGVLGYEVVALRRVGVAFLRLNGLRPGCWRRLTRDEVDRLKALVR